MILLSSSSLLARHTPLVFLKVQSEAFISLNKSSKWKHIFNLFFFMISNVKVKYHIHFTCYHLCVIQDIFRTLRSYLFNTYQQKTIFHQCKKCLLISLKVLVKWDRETKELKKKKLTITYSKNHIAIHHSWYSVCYCNHCTICKLSSNGSLQNHISWIIDWCSCFIEYQYSTSP